MKQDYTFSKSGKMDGYGMGVKYERVYQKQHNLLALVLCSLPLLPIAYVIFTHLS